MGSESSEEGDEEQKIKRRKNLYELKKKLEIETLVDIPDIVDEIETVKTVDNGKQISNGNITKDEPRTQQEQNKAVSDSSVGDYRVKETTPEIFSKSPSTSKDGSGVLQRFRHLSDRSWSSTSSAELSALEDARGSMPSSYQEEPVSWMPSCLSLSRRGSISSQSNDGNGNDGDNITSDAFQADNQFIGTRHLGMLNSKRHLDQSHMYRNQKDPESPRSVKLKKLTRELSSVRRKLEELENEFENSPGGYRLSHVEKNKHKPMRKLLNEQSRLKRQIRNCRDSSYGESCDRSSGSEIADIDDESRSDLGISDNEDSNSIISQTMSSLLRKDSSREKTPMMEIGILCNNNSNNGEMSDCLTELGMRNNNDATNRNLESMRNSLIDVEQRLKAQRAVAGRPYDLDSMTPEQLMQEKVDLQSALLQFEHLFGHPESVEEKALGKDVYDRYRSVKRYVRRSSSIRSKDPLELETIPEDLEMPLTLASPQHRINIETHASRCLDINILVEDEELA